MSDQDKQNLLLIIIDHLQHHYHSVQIPCIALLISRHYRFLADTTLANDQQQYYIREADLWLTRYINHSGYSTELQKNINDLLQLRDFIPLHP